MPTDKSDVQEASYQYQREKGGIANFGLFASIIGGPISHANDGFKLRDDSRSMKADGATQAYHELYNRGSWASFRKYSARSSDRVASSAPVPLEWVVTRRALEWLAFVRPFPKLTL